jgi:hypothetical protein
MRAAFENPNQFRIIQRQRSFRTGARRDVAEQLIHQLTEVRRHIFAQERACQQPHSAVDVESHAAGRHNTLGNIRCRHTADRKPVALVNIRHGQ